MAQTIEITTPLSILIPSDLRIIETSEYERLVTSDLTGQTWYMEDLRKRFKDADPRWIKDHLLYRFRDQLDIRNGGFVVYPRTKGKPWKCQALKMAQFIEDNWEAIMREVS